MPGKEEEHKTKHLSEYAALAQLRAELEGLADDELVRQNVVAIDALTTVRGVLSKLMELRPLMGQLVNFNVDHIDRLELYAMAFAGAHAQYQILREHNKEPEALIREGLALRSRLLNDIKVLVRRGLVPAEPLRRLHNGRGYTNVAADLLLLVALFHTHASVIVGKCAATTEEITRADTLADQLTVVVSHRRKPLDAEAAALKMRQRAFTAFSRAYSQVRRAVQFLRYDEGDADRFAPPLTGKRRHATKSHNKSDEVAQRELAVERSVVTSGTNEDESSNLSIPFGVSLPGSDPLLH